MNIITIEYFSDKPIEIEYGDVLLKKRDYGSIWLDNFSNISLVEYGFFLAFQCDGEQWFSAHMCVFPLQINKNTLELFHDFVNFFIVWAN